VSGHDKGSIPGPQITSMITATDTRLGGGSVDDEGPHRGGRMLPAGRGFRAGAQRCGHRPASLGGQDEAAHRAVKADQRRALGVHPHHRITISRSVVAPTRRSGAAGRATRGLLTAAARRDGSDRVPVVMHLTLAVDALLTLYEQGVIG
jgi:hypothetical protein